MSAGMPRNQGEHESRLDHLRVYTVAHPRLLKVKDALMNAINGAEPNSLIFVFGPTGVGKTTLRLKAEQLITTELLNELHEDRMRIPVVSVEATAPESGSFNWRDHYKRLLRQLDEPLIDYKVNRPRRQAVRRQVYGSCLHQEQLEPTIAMRWSRQSAIAGQSPL